MAAYRDLRDWIDILRQQDEVVDIRGASWDLQIGALVEIACRESTGYPPALLFRDIPGYPSDRRVLGALLSSPKRLALTLGLVDEISNRQEMVAACRQKLATMNLVPPVMVETGPVAANVLEGSSVDLLGFPVPRHHELDGGRYIGTAHCVITKDPDEGWVNLGTYRCMVLGPDKFALHMSPWERRSYHAGRQVLCPQTADAGSHRHRSRSGPVACQHIRGTLGDFGIRLRRRDKRTGHRGYARPSNRASSSSEGRNRHRGNVLSRRVGAGRSVRGVGGILCQPRSLAGARARRTRFGRDASR